MCYRGVVEMKKERLIGISLIVLIIAGMIYLSPSLFGTTSAVKSNTSNQTAVVPTVESSDVAGRLSHNLVMNSPQAEVVSKVMIYKTIPPTVTNETTLKYAKIFNVTGELKGACVVQSKDLRFGLEISKNSGSVRYFDQDRPNVKMDAPAYLPTDDAAIKIATKFLKDRDLYPEGAVNPTVFRENAIGGGNKVYYGQIGVWYQRMLNGTKVAGTQLVVYVAGNGDVIGYYANWRTYEPYKEYPVTSPQDAFGTLKTNGVPVGMNPADATVSIDEAYLAYHTTPGAYTEKYLEPVWVFKGNVMVDGKSVMPVEEYVPALTEGSLKELSFL
jgi:hypothetical protein